jgi:hypothetical protein
MEIYCEVFFFIGNQKVILFPIFRKNGWKTAASVLMSLFY